eukprot:2618936-Rhodomonas_salina.3
MHAVIEPHYRLRLDPKPHRGGMASRATHGCGIRRTPVRTPPTQQKLSASLPPNMFVHRRSSTLAARVPGVLDLCLPMVRSAAGSASSGPAL